MHRVWLSTRTVDRARRALIAKAKDDPPNKATIFHALRQQKEGQRNYFLPLKSSLLDPLNCCSTGKGSYSFEERSTAY